MADIHIPKLRKQTVRPGWGLSAPLNDAALFETTASRNPYAEIGAGSIKTDATTKRGRNVSKSISKRFSVRYNDDAGYSPTDAPTLPAMPPHLANASTTEARIAAELTHASATEIARFATGLRQEDEALAVQIKTNINDNYKHIFQLSTDLVTTEQDLDALRGLVNALGALVGTLQERARHAAGAPRARDRSSLLVLEKMWASALASLYKHVEGAAKFVPPVHGRHVVAESGRWMEVNAATWKPVQPIHLFVLNDHVLVATRKSRGGAARGAKLLALQCWPVLDTVLADVAPLADGAGAYTVNFRCHALSYLYQTDREDHYRKITAAFREAQRKARDLADKARASGRWEEKRVSGAWHSRPQSMDARLALPAGLAAGVPVGVRQARAAEALVDELCMAVARHQYPGAIALFDECQAALAALAAALPEQDPVLAEALAARVARYRAALVRELEHEVAAPATPARTAALMAHFGDLGLLHTGRDAFLALQTRRIQTLVHAIGFLSQVAGYVTQVAAVTFLCIREVVATYVAALPENAFSFVVTWAMAEVATFALFLKSQLYGFEKDSAVRQQCVATARTHAAGLKTVGLNVDFLLE